MITKWSVTKLQFAPSCRGIEPVPRSLGARCTPEKAQFRKSRVEPLVRHVGAGVDMAVLTAIAPDAMLL